MERYMRLASLNLYRYEPPKCSATSPGVFTGAHDGRQVMGVTDLLLPTVFLDHFPELLLPLTLLNFARCLLLLRVETNEAWRIRVLPPLGPYHPSQGEIPGQKLMCEVVKCEASVKL